MPRANIEVRHNLEEGMKTAAKLQDEIPESADDAASVIANQFIIESQRVLQSKDSVVTGTGMHSFKTRNMGEGKAGVYGAAYLDKVDKGTTAHWPDVNNPRFIAAARSYGMTRPQLAEVIARKGTEPHPWIQQAFTRVRNTARQRAQVELQKAGKKAISSL